MLSFGFSSSLSFLFLLFFTGYTRFKPSWRFESKQERNSWASCSVPGVNCLFKAKKFIANFCGDATWELSCHNFFKTSAKFSTISFPKLRYFKFISLLYNSKTKYLVKSGVLDKLCTTQFI